MFSVLTCTVLVLLYQTSSALKDVKCESGKTSAVQKLNEGDSFSFLSVGNRYKPNQKCTAFVKMTGCAEASVSCKTFSVLGKKKCKQGDVLVIAPKAQGGVKKFCGKKGPKDVIMSGDFRLNFISDKSGSGTGFNCMVTCTVGGGSGTLPPKPTGSQKPTPTGSQRPTPTGSQRPPPTGSLRPTPTGSPRPTPTGSPRPTPTGSPRPTPTGSPRPTPTGSPRPTPTGSPRPPPTGSPPTASPPLSDVKCESGKTLAVQKLNEGDSFQFFTTGKKYKPNQKCSADVRMTGCAEASVSCKTFNVLGKKKCKQGDVLVIASKTPGGVKKFCGKKGPKDLQMKENFRLDFFSDKKGSAKGFNCMVTCTRGGGAGTPHPPPTGSPRPPPTGSPRPTGSPPTGSPRPPPTGSPTGTPVTGATGPPTPTGGSTAAPPTAGPTNAPPTAGPTNAPGSIDCAAGCSYTIKFNQYWAQEINGYERTADVLVPATSSAKLPVVIDLHGSGGQAMTNRLGKFLKNSIIVAGQGYERQWNIVKEKTKAPDTDYVKEVIRQVGEIQQADMDDVTIFGTSNGAGMIYRLLIEVAAPRPFHKVIPTVSTMAEDQYRGGIFYTPSNQNNTGDNVYDQAIVPGKPGPEIHYFHGTADRTVPYEAGTSLGVNFIGAQEATYALAQAFGYEGAQLADAAGVTVQTGVTKYEYSTPDKSVIHYKMTDMGHNAFDPLYSDFVQDYIKTVVEG